MPWTDRWRTFRSRVRIAQVLAALGRLHEFRVQGPRLIGPCPVHGGDNRKAFSVHRERNLWFCFTRCQRGGTVVDLAWLLSGQSWSRAARWLEQLAMAPPDDPSHEMLAAPVRDRQASTLYRPYTRRLVLDPTHHFFGKLDLAPNTLRHFEAGAWYGKGLLEGTIAVRLHDSQGNPLGYAGRRLDPGEVRDRGKWIWPPRYPKGDSLWNWHRIDPGSPAGLVVVEGPWSVMKLWQAGITNAVALGGVSASTTQRRMLSLAGHLSLALDGDDAGRIAMTRLVAEGLHPRMRAIPCPPGTDPADLTTDELKRLLERD